MFTLSRTAVIAALAIGLAIAGCGDDNKTSSSAPPPPPPPPPAAPATSSGAAQTLKLSADPSALKFDKTSLSAKAGTVKIVMTNPSGTPHNVGVDGNGVDEDGPIVQGGKTSTVMADLKAGTYKFYCSVGDHRQQGMEGTLTVR